MYLYIVNLVHKHPCRVFYSVPRLTMYVFVYLPLPAFNSQVYRKKRGVNEGIISTHNTIPECILLVNNYPAKGCTMCCSNAVSRTLYRFITHKHTNLSPTYNCILNVPLDYMR